jgi:cytochrome c-type biogenesis protein CcmF
MSPEIGQLALAVALVFATLLAIAGLLGAQRQDSALLGSLGSLVAGKLVFIAVAYGLLTYAFLTDDFSVAYVAQNSNTLLPVPYKMSAVWGAHEGSFLLWTLIMACWTFAVAVRTDTLPAAFRGRVLGVMGLLSIGFLAFLLFASNPFERLLPLPPGEGGDLNPLLQDFGLIVHPPLLYTGYVGFSVAFAFAVAALLSGQLDALWARWSRPWTNVAWAFLTLGIALGSWWAYYELGWGGWWFWDPVENASFMPWLVGTALVHSLAVTEKRGTFKSWTLLLALAAFSLSLLGAFIVRSGVLTSVHAFAVDPTRGLFILGFLMLVVGGSLLLYALRAGTIRSPVRYGWLSREAFLLVNNVLLVVSMALVLIGTLYPLAYEAVTGGDKISVGVPYFNAGFVPLMLLLAAALGIAPALRWKRTPGALVLRRLGGLALLSVVLGLVVPLIVGGALDWRVVLTLILALWIVLAHGADLRLRARKGLGRIPAAYWGMTFAHLGFAAALIGVAITSVGSVEKDLRMGPGDSAEAAGYQFEFVGLDQVRGPNYVADQATLRVSRDDWSVDLLPQKRRYLARGNVMTEAAIDPGFTRDLYVSLGEPLNDTDWAVRIQVKPLVRWIWLGAVLAAIGGVVAVLDVRYRRARRSLRRRREQTPTGGGEPAPAPAGVRT